MKYQIKFRSESDPLFLPWDLYAESEVEGTGFPTVIAPHPLQGDKLMGFEENPQDCQIFLGEEGWQERAIGLSPVMIAAGGGMYSVPDYKVCEITIIEGEQINVK